MKRSPALIPLSRDHHHGLEAARRLRRATGDDLDAAIAHLEAFWNSRGRGHFEIEEELVLPALSETDVGWRRATTRVRDEHEQIRARVDNPTARTSQSGVQLAHELGELLNDHIRFEERHLFGMLEARLPEDRLMLLGRAVEAAEASQP
jgi:hemerythrin-like domain-containing protein